MRIPAVIAIALMLGAEPAWAWEEYAYPDKGFAIQFPVKPQIAMGVLDSTLVKGLPSTVYSAESEGVLYRLTEVDLGSHANLAAQFVSEVPYVLNRDNTVIFFDIPRVYRAEHAVYGITMIVDLPDGSRMRTSTFTTEGRLYRADAIALPSRGSKDMQIPSRFDQTLRWPPDGGFD